MDNDIGWEQLECYEGSTNLTYRTHILIRDDLDVLNMSSSLKYLA